MCLMFFGVRVRTLPAKRFCNGVLFYNRLLSRNRASRLAPTKVVEVRYDHFSDGRFRHGCTFLRVREDKLPKDCLLEQVVEHAAIQNLNAFIEAGLAIVGTNRK